MLKGRDTLTSISPGGSLPRRRLGRTGYEVSALGIGGFLGALDDPQAGRAEREAAAVQAVRRAVDLGITYFDTSPSYGDGERHLGLGLKELAPEERACLRVATKAGTHPERRFRYDADSILWSVEQSLRVLFADHVDVLLIHDPRSDAHLDEALGPGGGVEALERLKAQGVIGAIGLGVQSHRFQRRAVESGRFDVILTPYDYTLLRSSARQVIELAAARNVGVINGSPYAAGLLAGPDPNLAAKRRPPASDADLERARTLWRWCRERGVGLSAVAMQYSLRTDRIAVTLAGPRTAAEVEGNVCDATARLPADLWDDLEQFLGTLGPWTPGGEAFP